jgi:hypothetical protein
MFGRSAVWAGVAPIGPYDEPRAIARTNTTAATNLQTFLFLDTRYPMYFPYRC